MCEADKACAPCAAKKNNVAASFKAPIMQGRGQFAGASFQGIEQESGGRDMLVWGPASVEAVSEDAKLVRMSAIEAALPAAFRRGLISVLHKDQAVGHYRPIQPLDASRVPAGKARVLADYLSQAYGGAPTAVMEVTQAIVDAFPHLAPYMGSKQFFAGGVIYGDTETAKFIQDEIRQGHLNAYSIAGMPTQVEQLTVCNPEACKVVDDIQGIDLSSVTLGSINGGEGPFSAKVRNPGAAFITLQQADTHRHETSFSNTNSPNAEDTQMSTPPNSKKLTSAALLAQAEPHLQKLSDADRKAVAKLFEQVDETAVPDDMKAMLVELARRMDLIEQKLAAPAPSVEAPSKDAMEQAAAAAVKNILAQAKAAETPKPASTPAGDDASSKLLEAARTGDPALLMHAWETSIRKVA